MGGSHHYGRGNATYWLIDFSIASKSGISRGGINLGGIINPNLKLCVATHIHFGIFWDSGIEPTNKTWDFTRKHWGL
jgi:hypothetical protein